MNRTCVTATAALAASLFAAGQAHAVFTSFTDTLHAGDLFAEAFVDGAAWSVFPGTGWPYSEDNVDDGHFEITWWSSDMGTPYTQLGSMEYDANNGKLPGFGTESDSYVFTKIDIEAWMWTDRTAFDASYDPAYNTLDTAVIPYYRYSTDEPWVELDMDWTGENDFQSGSVFVPEAPHVLIEVYGRPQGASADNAAWSLHVQSVKLDGDDGTGSGLVGDFDQNGIVDADDIDILAAEIDLGSTDPIYDLDGINGVDQGDFTFMIETVLGTSFGDANLDLAVDLLDLSALASNFEGIAGWAGGNFNTDAVVDLLDLSSLASNFGVDNAVPAPASAALMTLALAALTRRS
ncbi:hypothetical protein [Mucisphaera calidilacus]|nr:hypothetical protein [Mucisphaera calidilacus]